MEKINNFSLIGYVLGTAFAVFSAIRYFLIFYDLDRALVYTLIGLLICSIAFLYQKYTKLYYDVDAIQNHIADKELKEDGNI